jgi:hypothetical protein
MGEVTGIPVAVALDLLPCAQPGVHTPESLAAGHAFMQNLRRGRYGIAADVSAHQKLPAIFDGLALVICPTQQDHAWRPGIA